MKQKRLGGCDHAIQPAALFIHREKKRKKCRTPTWKKELHPHPKKVFHTRQWSGSLGKSYLDKIVSPNIGSRLKHKEEKKERKWKIPNCKKSYTCTTKSFPCIQTMVLRKVVLWESRVLSKSWVVQKKLEGHDQTV